MAVTVSWGKQRQLWRDRLLLVTCSPTHYSSFREQQQLKAGLLDAIVAPASVTTRN
jgi:hypothetical protein